MNGILNGILNVNKPEGLTSQDVCAKLRRRLKIKKIGHTGTLDPMATGVLPVCVGKATRIIEYYDRDLKSYHAEMKLGITSDTLDITGEMLESAPYSEVSEKAVAEAFNAYMGRVRQVPPKYSALKVGGKRAYELAREGADFELAAREIEIVSNEVTGLDLENGIIEFDVCCSKGTYIRTMIDDIGRTLGCGAVMSALVRTGSGYFRIEDASGLDELMEMDDEEIAKQLIPMEKTLLYLGKVLLDDNRVTAFVNGNPSSFGSFSIESRSELDYHYMVYDAQGRTFLGIGELTHTELKPSKVLI